MNFGSTKISYILYAIIALIVIYRIVKPLVKEFKDSKNKRLIDTFFNKDGSEKHPFGIRNYNNYDEKNNGFSDDDNNYIVNETSFNNEDIDNLDVIIPENEYEYYDGDDEEYVDTSYNSQDVFEFNDEDSGHGIVSNDYLYDNRKKHRKY